MSINRSLACPRIDLYTVIIKRKGKAPETFLQDRPLEPLVYHHVYCISLYPCRATYFYLRVMNFYVLCVKKDVYCFVIIANGSYGRLAFTEGMQKDSCRKRLRSYGEFMDNVWYVCWMKHIC